MANYCYQFEMEKRGTVGEMIDIPILPKSPEAAGEVLRILLTTLPPDCHEIRIKVMEWANP